MAQTRTILFLCPHNAAKSVLAVAYFDRLAQQRGLPYRADSAGTEPEAAPAPKVVVALQSEGTDVSGHQPRLLERRDLVNAHRVISMGCGLSDLIASETGVEHWDEVPPVSRDLDAAYAEIRRRIDALVSALERERAESS